MQDRINHSSVLPIEMWDKILSLLAAKKVSTVGLVDRNLYVVIHGEHFQRYFWNKHEKTDFSHDDDYDESAIITPYERYRSLYRFNLLGLSARRKKLFSAVHESDVKTFKKNLSSYDDLDAVDGKYEPLYILACKHAGQDIRDYIYQVAFKYFLSEKPVIEIDPFKKDTKGFGLMHWAVMCNQPPKVFDELMKSGCDMAATLKTPDSLSPLELAIRFEHIEIFKLLTEKIDLSISIAYEINPLNLTVSKTDNPEFVKMMIEKGVDVNQVIVGQDTALSQAASDGKVAIAKLLLAAKANINATNSERMTPLHHAVMSESTEMIHLLINHGANINAENTDNETPLNLAIRERLKEVCQLLLTYGAKKNALFNEQINRIFIECVKQSNIEEMDYYVRLGADINRQSGDDQLTPLLLAIKYNQYAVVKYLLDHGANMDCPGTDNLLIFMLAQPVIENYDSQIALFYSHFYDRTSFYHKSDNRVLTLLLERGVRHPDLLHIIAKQGRSDLVSTAIAYGYSVDALNADGEPTLHQAILSGNKYTVITILKYGANVNLVNKRGQTALMLAVEYTHHEIIDILLDGYHVNMDAVNNDGMTALMIAAAKKRFSIVDKLLKHGADSKNHAYYANQRSLSSWIDEFESNLHLGMRKNNLSLFGYTLQYSTLQYLEALRALYHVYYENGDRACLQAYESVLNSKKLQAIYHAVQESGKDHVRSSGHTLGKPSN